MQYNFVIVRTNRGGRYARKILRSIKWLNENKYPQHEFNTMSLTIDEFMSENWRINGIDPENTIFHPRCANPRTDWTIELRRLQDLGFKVVNSVDTIELTSNKLACSLHLQGKVNHPKSWEWKKSWDNEVKIDFINKMLDALPNQDFIIAKPYTSLEQGLNVRKVTLNDGFATIIMEFDKVPGNKIVIQEYIPYTALHRVIVIAGKALPYTFIDKPEWHLDDWKVSCCLNRTTMKLNEDADPELLKLAENTQKEVGGVINFIDIFEYGFPDERSEWPMYTNAEINTACSLNIHERLAKEAGRNDWNIHFRIAKQLVKELLDV